MKMTRLVRAAIKRHLHVEMKNLAPESDATLHKLTRGMGKLERALYRREIKAIQTER